MSSLTVVDKRKFETLFGMSNGYVLTVSKSDVIAMIAGATGRRPPGVDEPISPSRAYILRQFWNEAPDSQVAEVLGQLVSYFEAESSPSVLTENQSLLVHCKQIIKRLSAATATPSHLEAVISGSDMVSLEKAIARIRSSVESDPALAIGSSKELIESVCKTILSERQVDIKDSSEYTELTRRTFSVLSLTPDDVPSAARGADEIKRMLASLNSIVRYVEAIRDLYGTGHGKHGRAKGLHPRHARLVSGCAEVLCMFLWESHTRMKP